MKSLSGFAIAAAAILAACGDQRGAGSGEKSSSMPSQRADALSSDGSRIAYREYNWYSYDGWGDWRLRIAYSDGTHPVDGTDPVHGGEYASAPAWSPDGTQLAFVSDYDDVYSGNQAEDGDIEVADLATGEVRTLNSRGWSLTWSPDGLKIAVGGYLPDFSGAGIYVMNSADGSGRQLVTSSASYKNFGRIDWSPDGSTFVFDCSEFSPGVAPVYEVCTVKIDGTGFAQLTHEFGGHPLSPAWSPDGKQIAFSTSGDSTGGIPEIKVMNADGTNVSRLVNGYYPTWSPDGSRIAFQDAVTATYDSSYSSIYTVQTDGAGVTKILSASSGWYSGVDTPAWSRSLTAPADQPPVASFTSSCDGLACHFDSSGSTDDVDIVSRSWAFGDGATAGDVVQPPHTYAGAGTYQVTLTVIDTAGQSGTATKTVRVTAPVDQPPVASFIASCSGLTCTFDSSGSTDDHGITARAWTFGDGTTVTTVDVTISHTYAARGRYVVTLTVRDTAEQSATATRNITVSARTK